MHNYRVLWHLITNRIAANRHIDFPADDQWNRNNSDHIEVFLKSLQIFCLELSLHRHREEHATLFEPLLGKDALHHKILTQTHWKLAYIEAMPLCESLLVIQDDLRREYLSPDAQPFLTNRGLPVYVPELDLILDADWDPRENQSYLTQA
ncbi:ECs1072 family phage-associated protein [Biostraticola tofi]|uniref:Uncharacterized protein n=1 Tax=Biostraticola tofi TaxID=466109 RepID=A0A4R3Z794_9GAMM|nr:hypothetical protein [Biostraticola tofi]TCW00081.1 hypothetical protein EDC52_101425 [Biostraticola tofi]